MVRSLLDSTRQLLKRPVVRGIFSILTAQVLRIGVQLAYFVLLTRTLGVSEYGLFVGVMAFVKLFYPFSSWGWPQILLKNVARDRTLLPQYWGNALLVALVLGSVLTFIITALSSLLFHTPDALIVVACIAIAELVFARFYDISLKAFAALDRYHLNAVSQILVSWGNLLASLVLAFVFTSHNAATWSGLYLLARAITAGISYVILFWAVRCRPRLQLKLIPPSLKEGFYFSIGLSSSTVYNDSDKTMLSQLSTLEATGVYGAAYRVVDVAMTPIMSVLAAISSRFFRKGEQGVEASLAFAKRLLPFVTAYGVFASASMYVFAGLLSYVFGSDYGESTEALRWLSLIVVFRIWQYFAADALTGSEYQGLRSVLQIAIALFNVILNFWLIPLYSWKGAAFSSLLSDAFLALSLWISLGKIAQKQAKLRSKAGPDAPVSSSPGL